MYYMLDYLNLTCTFICVDIHVHTALLSKGLAGIAIAILRQSLYEINHQLNPFDFRKAGFDVKSGGARRSVEPMGAWLNRWVTDTVSPTIGILSCGRGCSGGTPGDLC